MSTSPFNAVKGVTFAFTHDRCLVSRESARDDDEVLEHGSPGNSVPSTRRGSLTRLSNDRVAGGTTVSPTSSLHRVDAAPYALHRWTLSLTNNVEPLNPSPATPTTNRVSYIDNQINNSNSNSNNNTLTTSSPSSHDRYYPTIHDHHDPYPVSSGWDAAQISSWTQYTSR